MNEFSHLEIEGNKQSKLWGYSLKKHILNRQLWTRQ